MQTSADVVLLSACAVTVRDIAPAVIGRSPGVGAARALAPVYGGLGLLVALALGRDVLETLKLGYSIFAAGLILPVLVALLPRRMGAPAVPARGAIVAMVAGGMVAAAGRFLPALAFGTDPVLVGTGVNLAVLLASSAWSRFGSRLPAPGYRSS
jgi:Na+/proline symporter